MIKKEREKKRNEREVMKKLTYSVIIIVLCFTAFCFGNERQLFLRDGFDTLDNWEPLLFPKIPEHSTYTPVFKYEPSRAGLVEKIKYNAAKLFYGKYPPHSSLNYIWANKRHGEKVITSTYTERSKMIPLQQGGENVGTWHSEEVNILKDYQSAFGEDPPAIASLAIMNDSDNTKEQAVSYVDDIEIYK
ncbi:MAG: DUF3047 domain-containing protein [bacterium]